MIQFAEVRIDGERRFAFYEDGDGVIVNAGFIRMDEAEHWATWVQFEADYETCLAIGTTEAELATYRRLCPDWVWDDGSGQPSHQGAPLSQDI